MVKHDLIEWTRHYLRARDAFERKLVSIEDKTGGLLVRYKNRDVSVVARDDLGEVPAHGAVLAVCLQSEANFKTLLANFETYAKNPDLTIVFVNPNLSEKWLLKPAIHAAVADKTSLKTGLQSLFQTVPTV